MRMLLTLGIALSFFSNISRIPFRVQASTTPFQCPPFTFNTGHGYCQLCQKCDHFSIERRPCTQNRDTECLSCDGDNALQRPECRRCPPCPKGQSLSAPCTRRHPTKCTPCTKGSYNPKLSYSSECSPCTSCYNKGRTEVSSCTSVRDAVCGQCRKGYYSEHRSSRCMPCRSCVSSGQRLIQKCQNDGTGRNCGRIIEYVYNHAMDGRNFFKDTSHLQVDGPQGGLNAHVIFNENTTVTAIQSTLPTIEQKIEIENLLMIIILCSVFILFWFIVIVLGIFWSRNRDSKDLKSKSKYALLCPQKHPNSNYDKPSAI